MRRLTVVLLSAAGAAVLAASCGPREPEPLPAPRPEPPAPAAPAPAVPPIDTLRAAPAVLPPDTVVSSRDVTVGLAVDAAEIRLGGGDALVITDPAGGRLLDVVDGAIWRALRGGAGVRLEGPGGVSAGSQDAMVIAAARPGQFVRINGRDYRGEVTVVRGTTGLTAVNRVGVESYLAGVVSAEMGRREDFESQALNAQAVVSRTYAVRNQGKRRLLGFDFYASVADQVYGGVASETPMAWDAVRATRGLILTWNGAPADAFFYSTCGGRTERGIDVFAMADRPYLRSFHDVDANGLAYCRLSPRFRWREEKSGADLEALLRRTLPEVLRIDPAVVDRVVDVRVTRRTASGRAAEVLVRLGRRDVTVTGQGIRSVFRLPSGEFLRSTAFEMTAQSDAGRVSFLTIEGSGAGHGVGFCQWGAVGRAREGQGYEQILAAYYPSTTLHRLD
jgi:stage II sporulation protein D